MTVRRLSEVSGLLAAVVASLVCLTGVASASDSPTGYYYGVDGNGPAPTGSGYPWQEPYVGGIYGGYVGEIGTWTNWQGCTSGRALQPGYGEDVNADEPWPGWGPNYKIPGVFFYWLMAGPGADPAYNGTTAEANNWGQEQAQRAASQYPGNTEGLQTDTTYDWLMFMDIEGPEPNGTLNGWNEEVNSCGYKVGNNAIPAAVDRATFDGFFNYIYGHTDFYPGVYSGPAFWCQTFGCPNGPGSPGYIPNTPEWTYETDTGSAEPPPVGFCQSGNCAQWFGGVDTSHEVAWQWDSGPADYDQWYVPNLPGSPLAAPDRPGSVAATAKKRLEKEMSSHA